MPFENDHITAAGLFFIEERAAVNSVQVISNRGLDIFYFLDKRRRLLPVSVGDSSEWLLAGIELQNRVPV